MKGSLSNETQLIMGKKTIRFSVSSIVNFIMNKVKGCVTSEQTQFLKRLANSDADSSVDAKQTRLESERVKKRKVALLIAYSGQGYLGLQRNPGMKTIEEDLLTAMMKAGIINEEAYAQPQLLQFQRAARTDKGVSAVRQVLSLKIPEDSKTEDINKHLPDQIQTVAMKRVTKGFNSKNTCDARTYSYMLPTFSFAPLEEEINESYRATSDVIAKAKTVLKEFLGTHNFHNFTSRKRPIDPSAHRFMMSIECSEPMIIDGMEFVTIKVKGQSFMLHQIRKMVALAIAIIRGLTPVETISKAFEANKLDIPVAPGLGLVLEEVHYCRYNQRYGSDGIHENLEWYDYDNTLEEFKKKYILSSIVCTEKEEKSMLTWLETLPKHSFDVREEENS